MKKKVLFVAALFIGATTFAQDGLTSKKGEAILPEAGDWAIGFDANPFINYFGNAIGQANGGNSLAMPWTNTEMAITGKMFKDESTAYRGAVRIGFGSSSSDNIISNLMTNPSDTDPTPFTNTTKNSNFNIVLGGGIEKRKGSTRIQGFYGAEAYLMFGSSGTTMEYGVALGDSSVATGQAVSGRTTETKNGSTFGFGARGFVGVEWFVAPKVSIAAEYGWGLNIQSTGAGESTIEEWKLATTTATAPSLVTTTTETGGNSSFGIDTDNNSGRLTLLFHF